MNALRQYLILVQRNFAAFFGDRTNCFWVVAQIPINAILAMICFYGFTKDDRPLDYFMRFNYHAEQYLDQQEKAYETIEISKRTARDLYAQAETDHARFGPGTAQRRAGIYFLLVSAAIWFGLMGSCKEIVSEQSVLFREARSCLSLPPYLAAKFTMQMVILAVQNGLLAILTVPLLLGLDVKATRDIALLLWMASCTAACLGLCLSSISSNVRVAMTLVPLLMIPQFLFGGLLRPQPIAQNIIPPEVINPLNLQFEHDPMEGTRTAISSLIIQRWAFEGVLGLDDRLTDRDVLTLGFRWPDVSDTQRRFRRDELLRIMQSIPILLADVVFQRHHPLDPWLETGMPSMAQRYRDNPSQWRIARAVAMMAVMAVGLLCISYLALRLKFR